MTGSIIPIDRRSRAARTAREELRRSEPARRRGRPCDVCRAHETGHPRCEQVRTLVDAGYGRGYTNAELARRVADLCEGWPPKDVPSARSIENHTLKHSVDSVRLARDMAAERMRQYGETEARLLELYLEPLVDTSYSMAMAARDALATGAVRIRNMADVARALDMWARFKPTASPEGVPVEQHKAELATVIESARRNMTGEEYDRFVADLRAQGRKLRPEGTGDPAG